MLFIVSVFQTQQNHHVSIVWIKL
uniref:Uncharacterized protein n=1 Tax=Anguilla anguilla TaxID=7936 RepID=A0A0E9Q3W1_ANGAN